MRVRRSTTDAVASTAISKDRASWAWARASSTTIARALHCASSCRIIRSPVDAAQVVADLVLAQREELLAVSGLCTRVHGLDGGDQAATRLPRGEDLVHARAHEHFADGRNRPCPSREPERVRYGDRERADPEAAPACGRQTVGGAGALTRWERRQDEPGRPAAVVEHVGHDE